MIWSYIELSTGASSAFAALVERGLGSSHVPGSIWPSDGVQDWHNEGAILGTGGMPTILEILCIRGVQVVVHKRTRAQI
jgi:hypothetical protein